MGSASAHAYRAWGVGKVRGCSQPCGEYALLACWPACMPYLGAGPSGWDAPEKTVMDIRAPLASGFGLVASLAHIPESEG